MLCQSQAGIVASLVQYFCCNPILGVLQGRRKERVMGLIVQCGWCGKIIYDGILLDNGREWHGVSHTICGDCLQIEREKMAGAYAEEGAP